MEVNLGTIGIVIPIIGLVAGAAVYVTRLLLRKVHAVEKLELKRELEKELDKCETDRANLGRQIETDRVRYERDRAELGRQILNNQVAYERDKTNLERQIERNLATYQEKENYLKRKIEELERERLNLKEGMGKRDEEIKEIHDVGYEAVAAQKEIWARLRDATTNVSATASSLCVPTQSDSPSELVFLCAVGPVEDKLKKVKIPLSTKSIVGKVFQTGRPYKVPDAEEDEDFYGRLDQLLGFKSRSVLAVPVRAGNRTIAVAEFLNKRAGTEFNDQDLNKAELFAGNISNEIDNFLRGPEHLTLLGITPSRHREEGVVLIFDMTNSHILTENLEIETVIKCINEFLKELFSPPFLNSRLKSGFELHYMV